MPYSDPEKKRQWEREHREQRNERRRRSRRHSGSQVAPQETSVEPMMPEQSRALAIPMGLIAILLAFGLLMVIVWAKKQQRTSASLECPSPKPNARPYID